MKITVIKNEDFNNHFTKNERNEYFNSFYEISKLDHWLIEGFKSNDSFLFNENHFKKFSLNNLLFFVNPVIESSDDINRTKTLSKNDNSLDVTLNNDIEVYNNELKKLIKVLKNNTITISGIHLKDLFFIYNNTSNNNLNKEYDNIKLFNIFNKFKLTNLLNKASKLQNKLRNNNKDNLIFIDNIENYKFIYETIINYLQYYEKNLNFLIFNQLENDDNKSYNKDIFNVENLVKNNKIIELFNNLIDDYKIGLNYNDNIYFTLKQNNLNYLYDQIKINGIDNQINQTKIKLLKSKIDYQKLQEENELKLKELKLKHIEYKLIVKDVFPELFNIEHKSNIFNYKNEFDIYKLPSKYKKITDIHYEKYLKFKENYINNKCPHLELLYLFRNEKNINIKFQHFQSLKEFINLSIKNDSNFYKCNNCSFDILCPHIEELYTELFNNKNENLNNIEVNKFENKIRQKIIIKYMGNSHVNFTYFCKVCSEELGKNIGSENIAKSKDNNGDYYHSEMDEITKKIISISYVILMKYVDTNNLMLQKNKLTFIIANGIYEYIQTINNNLLKSKTILEDEVNNKLQFHITLYVFTYIVILVHTNNNISIKSTKTGGKDDPNSYKSLMITVFNILKRDYKNLIIKSKFTDENISKLLINYLTQIEKINNIISSDNFKFTSIVDEYRENFKKLFNKNYTLKNNKIETYKDYVFLSFKSVEFYVNNKLYEYSPYENHHHNYNENIISLINDYNKSLEFIKEFEKIFYYNKKWDNLSAYFSLKPNLKRNFNYVEPNLNLYYTLEGKKQKFNKFEFKDDNNKKYLFESNEIEKIIDIKNYKLINKYNSFDQSYNKILNFTEKERNDANEIIKNKFKENDKINGFFKIYNKFCIKGDFHEFNENNKCKKCDITEKDIINKKFDYFKKYESVYDNYLKEQKNILNEKLKNTIKEQKTIEHEINVDKYDNELINLDNYINTLSIFSNIHKNYFLFMGLIENLEYDEIVKMNYEIKNNNDLNHIRFKKLYNYNKLFLVYYNNFKNKKETYELKPLYNNISDSDLSKLPEITNILYDLDYLKTKIKTEKLNNIAVYLLLNNIIKIYNKFKFTNEFIKFIIKKIIDSDMLYSNYNILEITKIQQEYLSEGFNENDENDENDEEVEELFNYDGWDLDNEFENDNDFNID